MAADHRRGAQSDSRALQGAATGLTRLTTGHGIRGIPRTLFARPDAIAGSEAGSCVSAGECCRSERLRHQQRRCVLHADAACRLSSVERGLDQRLRSDRP